MIFRTQFSTVLGEMSAAATEQGVCFLEFTEDNRREDTLQLVSARLKMAVTDGNHPHLALLESQLQDYFAGKRMIFTVPLVLREHLFSKKSGMHYCLCRLAVPSLTVCWRRHYPHRVLSGPSGGPTG